MFCREVLYRAKKDIIDLWTKYMTVDGGYDCILPDAIYLKLLYKKKMGVDLDLKNPVLFSEKLQWLKLHDRKKIYHIMVDKYAVREYISKVLGEEYLVPLIGSWDRIEDIDFGALPEQFVFKCNHDNGVIICKDKKLCDSDDIKKQIAFHLQRDWYRKLREWVYKGLPRKIICEKYMTNEDGSPAIDFKVFCFHGEVKFFMLNRGRFTSGIHTTDHYDQDWKYMDMQDDDYPNAGDVFPCPKELEQLKELAHKLSKDIPFVRVDFNYWNHKIYFGEMTFYHNGGFGTFHPLAWNRVFGDWLKLKA